MELVSGIMRGVERSLDGLSARHEAIASNIANINTPGYVKQQVAFEESLREALASNEGPSESPYAFEPGWSASITAAKPNVLLTWQPQATAAPDGPQRLDGNRTPIETEMSGMAQNAIKYNAVTSVVSKQYQLLKTIAQAR